MHHSRCLPGLRWKLVKLVILSRKSLCIRGASSASVVRPGLELEMDAIWPAATQTVYIGNQRPKQAWLSLQWHSTGLALGPRSQPNSKPSTLSIHYLFAGKPQAEWTVWPPQNVWMSESVHTWGSYDPTTTVETEFMTIPECATNA